MNTEVTMNFLQTVIEKELDGKLTYTSESGSRYFRIHFPSIGNIEVRVTDHELPKNILGKRRKWDKSVNLSDHSYSGKSLQEVRKEFLWSMDELLELELPTKFNKNRNDVDEIEADRKKIEDLLKINSVSVEKIVEWLEAHDLINVTGLERKCDIPHGSVSNALAGRTERLSEKHLPKLIEVLGNYGFK